MTSKTAEIITTAAKRNLKSLPITKTEQARSVVLRLISYTMDPVISLLLSIITSVSLKRVVQVQTNLSTALYTATRPHEATT